MAVTATHARPSRLPAYVRLAKLAFFDYFLSIAVAWTALAHVTRVEPGTAATLLVFFLGEVAVFAAVVAFDDVAGFRDGSDAINYRRDGSGLRGLARKPLLTGVLGAREATAFGYGAACAGVGLWALAVTVAPHRPGWAVALAAVVLVASVQYSWGLKLSYRGGGELVIVLTATAFVAVPYGLAAGDLPSFVLVQAVLFGLWQVLVSCYSNTNDVRGDAAVGRRTVAVMVSARGNRLFVAALTGADLLLITGSAALGAAPWWFPVAMLPQIVLRVRQLAGFLRGGNALLARRRGLHVHRAGVASLVLINLILGAT